MKKSVCLASVAVVLMAGYLGWDAAYGGARQSSAKLTVCPGLGCQSDKCECAPGEKCQGCPCSPCSADKNCACITAARASAGTIKGTVSVYRTKVKTTGSKSDKDVVIYLQKVGNNDFPPPTKQIKVDQKGLVFIPHVLAVQKGTTVEFLNNDNDNHNVYLVDETNKTNDLGTAPPGKSIIRRFDKPKRDKHGIAALNNELGMAAENIALCKIHLEMAAYVVVLENPFFTMAPIDGKSQKAQYTIRNVPPGKYQLNIWHKKLKLRGGAREIVVEQGKTTTVDMEITKAKYAKKKD
jgi:plastocyanin